MATLHAFFIEGIQLEKGDSFEISSKEYSEIFHQLYKVFRAKVGMKFHLLNNEGDQYLAVITEITNREIFITIESTQIFSRPPQKKLWLPIIKPATAEIIVRMCTEIGITEFQFFEGEYSNEIYANKLLSSNQFRRFSLISQEAAEQSEKVFLPDIITDLASFEDIPLSKDTLVMIERNKNTKLISPETLYSCSYLLLGPEGGFSEEEKKHLLSNEITTISFLDTILKVETAAAIGAGMMCLKQ